MEFIKYALISLTVSFALAPIVIGLLYKLKLRQQGKIEVDKILQGRKRTIGVPVMGGSIIVITVLILYFVLGIHKDLGYTPVVLLVGGAFVGFLDDFIDVIGKQKKTADVVYTKVNPIVYRNFFTWKLFQYLSWPFRIFSRSVDNAGSVRTGLKASHKLFLEIILAFVISYLFYIEKGGVFWIPAIGSVDLGIFSILVNSIFMVLICIGFSVADGIDGMSAGTHAIAFAMVGILAYFLGNETVASVCLIIVGAELTFYYFNIPPARVEMSDIGTVPLGMLFVLLLGYINRVAVSPVIGFVHVAEFLSSFLQTFWVMFFSKKLFKMAPIHHHFEMLGWSPEKIVMRFYFISLVVGLSGVLLGLSL